MHHKCHKDENDGVSNQKPVYRILVVDDDPDITLDFKRSLEEDVDINFNGMFKVDTFNDPLLALLAISPPTPFLYDLLLFDVRMPKMGGFILYQEIKKITKKDIKVCFITSFEIYYESLKHEFPSIDRECFIRKPIKNDELRRRVKAKLES